MEEREELQIKTSRQSILAACRASSQVESPLLAFLCSANWLPQQGKRARGVIVKHWVLRQAVLAWHHYWL